MRENLNFDGLLPVASIHRKPSWVLIILFRFHLETFRDFSYTSELLVRSTCYLHRVYIFAGNTSYLDCDAFHLNRFIYPGRLYIVICDLYTSLGIGAIVQNLDMYSYTHIKNVDVSICLLMHLCKQSRSNLIKCKYSTAMRPYVSIECIEPHPPEQRLIHNSITDKLFNPFSGMSNAHRWLSRLPVGALDKISPHGIVSILVPSTFVGEIMDRSMQQMCN